MQIQYNPQKDNLHNYNPLIHIYTQKFPWYLTQKEIININTMINPMLKTQVDQSACSMMLDIAGMSGGVVGVEPLIRWQDELGEGIWDLCSKEGRVMMWVERQCSYHLQHGTE